ncbi:MAG TPA: ABC transporter ATP-binding protein [Clostridia bacterium]|nr:ABC transporter ATP-binding protein [Clostridia bacterium]
MENENPVLIELKDVSMMFRLPTQKVDNIKEFFIKAVTRKLKYREFLAIDNINLTVRKGESLGLIGRNGAGKSTLLKIIAGILTPTKGKVSVNGSIAPLINLGAGFDHEATAQENVYLNGAILGFSRKEMEKKYNRIVDFSELKDFMNVPIKNFSSGMLARLGFAIAVDVEPDILLVDEVLAVGDAPFRKKCHERIDEMRNKGTTYIFVSHSLDQVKRLCTHTIWLKNGRIFMYGPSKEVCAAYEEDCKKNPNIEHDDFSGVF